MDANEHCRLIGGIVTNFQALELHLRYFLLRANGQPLAWPKPGEQQVANNYLTNRKPLNVLLDEYNDGLRKGEEQFSVDREIVDVRDAIAHGRLVTPDVFPATLLKFSKARGGHVRVDFSKLLTREWLVATSNKIDKEREKVLNLFKARGYKGLS